jgi:hypothetical protein
MNKAITVRVCGVKGCERTNRMCRGLCWTHYMRWYTTGDVGSAELRFQPRTGRSCAVAGCEDPLRYKGHCNRHGAQLALNGEIQSADLDADMSPRACRECGETYTPKTRKRSWFCSRECKADATNAKSKAQLRLQKESQPVRTCAHCGQDMPQSMRSDAKFCSDDCNSSAHALVRNLIRRGGSVDGGPRWFRAEIAVRDAYECQLCGGSVDMAVKYPDPLFASLDHVVPVSAGGSSSKSNLQLAHLVCNVRRGDTPLVEAA